MSTPENDSVFCISSEELLNIGMKTHKNMLSHGYDDPFNGLTTMVLRANGGVCEELPLAMQVVTLWRSASILLGPNAPTEAILGYAAGVLCDAIEFCVGAALDVVVTEKNPAKE